MGDGILVAHDLTARSEPLVRTGQQLAERYATSLTVLHVMPEEEVRKRQQGVPEEGAYLDVILEKVERELIEVVGREGTGPPSVRTRVREGRAEEVVIEELEKGAYAFLVLGTRSRSRVGKFLLGSTTQAILLQSPCPVVTVPVAA
jgi:nucleotide-binding universal stress UspA family protein